MTTIPLRNDLTYFSVQVALDGVTYTLSFRWIVRLSAWFMHVTDSQDVSVFTGDVRLVAGFPLMGPISTRQPAGLFVAVDTSGQGLDPGLTDLGDRVQLVYVTQDELLAIKASKP